MIDRTDRFDAAVRGGATLVTEAMTMIGGVDVGADPLPVLDGSYTIDTNAAVRRRASFTIGTDDPAKFIPAKDWQLDTAGLWPNGNEISLRCGVQYRDGTREMLPCGVYRIANPRVTKSVDGGYAVTIDAYDRARTVSRSRFRWMTYFPAGFDYATLIAHLVGMNALFLNGPAEPGVGDYVNFMQTSGGDGGPVIVAPTENYSTDDDPWQIAQELATDIGAELFFGADGLPVLRRIRDPLSDPADFTFAQDETSILVDGSRSLDDGEAYSGVVVVAEGGDLPYPLRAEAWDLNPNSPTYFDPNNPGASRYGRVPYRYTAQNLTDQAQTVQTAGALLAKHAGLLEAVEISGLVHYGQDGGDLYSIVMEDVGVNAIYIADQLTIPLTPTGTTRMVARSRVIQ